MDPVCHSLNAKKKKRKGKKKVLLKKYLPSYLDKDKIDNKQKAGVPRSYPTESPLVVCKELKPDPTNSSI